MDAAPTRLALDDAAVIALLAGCAEAEGPQTSQTRTVEAFRAIEFRGAGRLDVLVGEQQSVVVEGRSGAIERLTTEVRAERLVIESQAKWWQRAGGKLHVRVTLPKLDALELSGAGQISVNGLAGGDAAFVLSGAGQLEGSGRVDRLTARVNGAGQIDLSRVSATDAVATMNGAGSIEVTVNHQLDATVNGVGSIKYGGKPVQVQTSINGVGSIGPR